MPKLSEPQKRVLRTMYACGCLVYVRDWGHGFYCWDIARPSPYVRPHIQSLRALERGDLLGRIDREYLGAYDLCLTPKGREVAQQLEEPDAQD